MLRAAYVTTSLFPIQPSLRRLGALKSNRCFWRNEIDAMKSNPLMAPWPAYCSHPPCTHPPELRRSTHACENESLAGQGFQRAEHICVLVTRVRGTGSSLHQSVIVAQLVRNHLPILLAAAAVPREGRVIAMPSILATKYPG